MSYTIGSVVVDGRQIDIVTEPEESLESSSSVDEPIEDEAFGVPKSADAPTTFSGNKYYTPSIQGNFYTPWGTEGLSATTNYFEITVAGFSIVILLCFAIPYVIEFLTGIIDDFKDGVK